MSSVDNRIVNMQFNNRQFQSGAADSINSLEQLEKTIADTGGDSSLAEMGAQVDGISARFGALQVAGVAALATIASQATSAAIRLGTDLLGAVTGLLGGAGFSRAIDIQQAKFQFRGLGLDVKEVMDNATEAVDGTAFALNEAATTATSFAGSGVKAGDEMTTALRGVAGVAAQTGTSFNEIGQIFAGVAGTGKLTTQDFYQFGTRGLNITKALAKEIGVARGEIAGMLSEGEIDFKTFAAAMDNAFGKNAAQANRTFTGALANMKTAITRIGADFFAAQLKPFGDVFNALSGIFKKVQNAMAPVSEGLGKLSEAAAENIVKFLSVVQVFHVVKPLIEGFKNLFAPLAAIFRAVGEAWLTVFPSQQHQSRRIIVTIAKAFELLTAPLAWIAKQIPLITPLFVAFFEVLRIGWTVVGGLGRIIGELVHQASGIGSGIVEGILGGLTGEQIQNEIVKFANSIVKWIKDALGIHSPADELIPVGTSIVEGIVQGIIAANKFLAEALGKLAMAVVDGFKSMFEGMDPVDFAALFNAIVTGSILLSIRSISKSISGFVGSLTNTLNAINQPLQLLTQSLKIMQTEVRAQLITSIAIAVGVLTASIIALSLLDPKKAAVGVGFLAAELALMIGTMGALSKINPVDVVASAAAIVLISSAMLILAGAIAVMGHLPTDEVGQGLTTLAIALALMVGSVRALAGLGPATLAAGGALLLLANAMLVMSGAIAVLAAINPSKMSHALTTMAVALGLMIGSLALLGKIAPEATVSAGAIIIVAGAIVLLTGAIAVLAAIDPGKMSDALTTLAVAFGVMVGALALLGKIAPEAIASAGAILIVSLAMLLLARALSVMGEVGPEKMSQGLTTMAVALGIFLAAAALAEGIAPGLITLSGAILTFGAGIALMGAGLLAAATGFSIFAAVGSAGIAVMVAAISAFMALLPQFAIQLAAAFVEFVKAIAASAGELRKAFGQIIKSILKTVQDAIPELRKTANLMLGAFLQVVTNNVPKFGRLIEAMIREGLRIIRSLVPDYVRTGVAIIVGVLNGIAQRADQIVHAGVNLVVSFLDAIGDQGDRIIRAAVKLVKDFVDALPPAAHDLAERLSTVGFDIAIAIADGIYDGLVTQGVQMVTAAVQKLVEAIPGPIRRFLGIESPSKLARWWGEMLVAGFVLGITDNIKYAVGATIQLANAVVAAGDKVVAKAQRDSRKKQIAAERAAARASLSDRLAKEAEREAQRSPKNKQLQQAAAQARKIADAQQKIADAAQRRADAASQKVSDVQAFRDADDQGKGDILTARAEELTSRAIRKLAEANAAAQAAKKATGRERRELHREAVKDAREAKRLADRARADQQRARGFFAQAVKDRIAGIRKEQKAEEKAAAEQEEFDKATDAEKITILENRAEAARKRAEAEQKQSEALVKQARKLARTDAVRAQRLLDRAERLADKADADAEEAKQNAEQAQQIAEGDGGTGGVTFELSRSALEDAASAIDRYTKSLAQAEEAAMAEAPVIQFVQTNTSPESLSPTTIYRQTKNLLTAAEIKMAEPVPTG